jgi:hypothetical protein
MGEANMTGQSNEPQSATGKTEAAIPVPDSILRESIPRPVREVAEQTDNGQATPVGGGSIAATPEARAKFAEETHQYIRDNIRLADQKATFFFTAATALLAFLYQNRVSEYWLKPVMTWNILDICAFGAMISLAIGALLSLSVVMPRLPGSRRGFLFWEAIAEFDSGRQYADDLATLSQATLAQQKAEHCHDLAKVCRAKYQWLKIALVVCGVGLTFAVIVFLVLIPGGGIRK